MAVNPRQAPTPAVNASSARERVLSAAYGLFIRRGVRSVGVDEIIAAAAVAKATFYRHFSSKDALIVAFFKRREELWTRQWLEQGAMRRGAAPEARLLAIFDLFDEWFQSKDFEGCPFVSTVAKADPRDHVRAEAVAQLATIRSFVNGLAGEAGVEDADGFAVSWQLLMEGSIVMALSGDRDAARRAKRIGEMLLTGDRRAA